MKNLDQAIKSLDKTIELRKNFSECYYEKGAKYLDKNNFRKCLFIRGSYKM